MRQLFPLFPALAATVVLSFIAGCGGSGGGETPLMPVAAPAPQAAKAPLPTELDASQMPHLDAGGGMLSGVLGVYYFERDPADPLSATLTAPRLAQAPSQGNLHHLSIRPFMAPNDLALISSTAGPNNTTDYIFRFTHPYDLPTNLDPPSTASKRLDLFIFDVSLVVAADGGEVFFGGSLKANIDAVPNADGYRQIGPLLDVSGLQVADTNVFPYKLIADINPGNPAGNYDRDQGWIYNEYLSASGYDVVPQGAQIEVMVRVSNTLPNDPLPLVVLAKYMDPRNGNAAQEKRGNRLPNPDDPTALRYFLPEACGDIQHIAASVSGSLIDVSSTEQARISLTVRDWDQTNETAQPFPDQSAPTKISERSVVQDCQVSIPALKAAGPFSLSSTGVPYGLLNEFIDLTFLVNNPDMALDAPPEGMEVPGLIRLRDSQDFSTPHPVLLNEDLVPVSAPPGYEPSTRYQVIRIPIERGSRAPQVVAVEPLEGVEGEEVTLRVTATGDPIETWSWTLTFAFDPPVSTEEEMTVKLLEAGTQRCAVTVGNAAGSDAFYFDFVIHPPAPDLGAVTPDEVLEGESAVFSVVNNGGPASSWDWDFGTGVMPSTSTDATPLVTGAVPGFHSGSVTATNITGQSTVNFDYFVIPAAPPQVLAVLPAEVYGRRPVMFTAQLDPLAGRAETWSWDFGDGCTPNESDEEQPLVTSGMPQTATGSVTVGNAYGETRFDFTYEIKVREAGMNVYLIHAGTVANPTWPTLWWNLPSWSQEDVRWWFDEYVNSVFEPSAVRIDPERITLIPLHRPDLYNLDNATENNALFNLLYNGGDWSVLNYWIINRNNYSGWAGVMSDANCNFTNANRGCIGVSRTDIFAWKIAAHELGHVFNLPHTRTNTNPLQPLNYNLMGYGTNDVSLLEWVTVQTPGSCQIWSGNPHSQYQVVNDWWNQYSGLPE